MQGTGRQLAKLLTGMLAGLMIVLTAGAGRALAVQSASAGDNPVVIVADQSELEVAYKAHCERRREIARKLSLLWFEEKELIAEYEDTGRTGELPDFVALAGELRQVRLNIDAARADLSRENKIILSIGDMLPE